MIAESLPSDLAAAHAMILAERAARMMVENELVDARAEASGAMADLTITEALIAHLKLAIEKLRRALYGSRSERQARLLDQMELELEELEAAASEDALAAEAAAQASRTVPLRRRPSRRPFPEHLPRERVVIAAPATCPCCGSAKLSKLGEDITETLEMVPRRWKVIQTVRERFSCRDRDEARRRARGGPVALVLLTGWADTAEQRNRSWKPVRWLTLLRRWESILAEAGDDDPEFARVRAHLWSFVLSNRRTQH